jgi:hypothetical protein
VRAVGGSCWGRWIVTARWSLAVPRRGVVEPDFARSISGRSGGLARKKSTGVFVGGFVVVRPAFAPAVGERDVGELAGGGAGAEISRTG